jgi:hypothetical protein
MAGTLSRNIHLLGAVQQMKGEYVFIRVLNAGIWGLLYDGLYVLRLYQSRYSRRR